MMKIILAALALGAVATPALAQDNFTGPRVEVTAGLDDVTKARDVSDVIYGANVGLDAPLTGNVIVGVEASIDNVFNRDRTVGVAARAGVLVTDNVLLYGKAGYENFRSANYGKLDGLRLGAGIEAKITGPVYGKVEYRYSDLAKGVGRQGGFVGVGIRW